MKTVVIMPGGFHPFHAGHFDLYKQAKAAFPGADVYVAATDDTSERPFPFEVKQKLAQLAGVDTGHFVRVKSPFAATEITDQYDPNDTVLVFVKSDKNAKGGPSPEGPFPAEPDPQTGRLPLVKRGPNKGKPVSDRLQYYRGNEKNLKPMSRHSYLAYLKTKPFMGMTSGSDIRARWPNLDDDGKKSMVNGLYPRTAGNQRLTNTVIRMLDLAIMGMAEGLPVQPVAPVVPRNPTQQQRQQPVYAPPLDRRPPSPAAIIHITPTKEDQDYVEEKWSQKYKNSINCANPRGFSQRAHCAGRRKNEEVAESADAEAYKAQLLATLPQIMRFYAKNVKGWRPSREQMLAAVETGYTVMKHTGDVQQAGRAVMDELNSLYQMSQGQQDVTESQGEIQLGPQLFVNRQLTTEGIKPRAAAWTSTAQKTDQGFTSDWVEWCKDNMAQWVNDTGILYDVAPGARILLLRTDRDVIRVAREYGLEIKNAADLFRKMDWDVLRKDYDAIHHIPQGRGFFMSAWGCRKYRMV